MRNVPDSNRSASGKFQQVVAAFLTQPGLPFASVLSAERIERVFTQHGNLFGMNAVYSTAVMVWSFLSQVLRDGKEASCQAAVARIVSHREQAGLPTPTADTGDYCRARAKLSEAALCELTREVAAELQEQADPQWLWKGLHAKLVDGFTFTMPDSASNRAEFPHPRTQKTGVGLPIARAAVILSLATGCAMNLALGPYSGKETGETALLRGMLQSFQPGEPLVADRYFCSFFLIALLHSRGVQVCARMHHKRHVDFRRGRRLGPHDHLIVWIKQSLNLNHVRCKSPAMVRKELWTTLLGYNLIRTTAAAAALLHQQLPRQISFTGTCQYVLASWMLISCGLIEPTDLASHCLKLLSQIASCEVANRPGRIEPRVLKRRRHGYKLMQQPRAVLKAQLQNPNSKT